MKEIIISSTKKIGSDRQNYIYYEKCKRKRSEKEEDIWRIIGYYSSLKSCYNDLLEEFTRIKDKETLKKNLEETVKMLDDLKLKAESNLYPELQ